MDYTTVSGRVAGRDGRSIAGAHVMFAYGPVALPDIAQVTDANGAFALTAPVDGIYRIVVKAPGFEPVERDVAVRRQAPTSIQILVG
jgi:hypothetical protein